FVLRNDLRDLLEPAALGTLERDVLPAYLAKRRWFGGKGSRLSAVRIIATAFLPRSTHAGPTADCAQVLLTEIEVDTGIQRQRYQIPLTIFFEDHPMPALAHQLALARVRRRQRAGVLTDGIASEFLARSLVETIAKAGPQGMALDLVEGSTQSPLQFTGTAALQGLNLVDAELEVRTLAVEQSNSSVILGEQAVLKMLRRLFAGRHPEVDMSGALTEGGFTNTAPLLGYV